MRDVWNGQGLNDYLERIVNEDDIEEHLIQESRWKVSYRESQLRRRNLLELHNSAMELADQQMNWNELGVSDQARETLAGQGVKDTEFQQFFAHPQILIQFPELFDYYRTLAGVSENRLSRMDTVRPAVRSVTTPEKPTRIDDTMRRLCRYFNSLISTWASGITEGVPEQRALVSALLTEGAAIEGFSRNAGGKKAVVNVASVIVEDLDEQGVLDGVRLKQTTGDDFERISAGGIGESYPLSDLSGAYDVDTIHAKNGGVVNFTEPAFVFS